MDFDDSKQRAVFFEIHSGLPREGPGDRESTAWALDLAGPLPERPDVLDIGCGPGMQTLHLAELLPGARITAVDLHPPFVAEVDRRAAEAGVADRVAAEVGDMADLRFAPASFDLIWSEGAAYSIGVGAALRAWKPLLRPGGRLALTEAVWLDENPPDRVRRMWEEYPAMGEIASNRTLVDSCGYDLLGELVLPRSAWWDDYYAPMQDRLDRLASKYAGDPVAEAVIAESREEIAVFREHGDTYGYVFLVMTPR